MKDPAFLFYPGDWLGGTMHLTRHQKGCYMDLLIAQFNSGSLSLESIKTILGSDQASWAVLSSKFKKDSQGNYFNERLASEIEKRRKYSESRRNNINSRYEKKSTYVYTHVEHMNIHMENENENKEKIKGVVKKEETELQKKFKNFQKWINENAANVAKMKEPFTIDEYERLSKDFDFDFITKMLLDMHNWKDLVKKNVNANLTFRKWASKR